jgi:hypothetical protein
MSKKLTQDPIPEFKFIHQISMKYYQSWEEMLEKIKYYIFRYFDDMKPYLDMTDEVYRKYKVEEVFSGDIVNEWDGSVVFKIDFMDYDDPQTMLKDLLTSLKVYFTNNELKSRILVVHLVHHILPF